MEETRATDTHALAWPAVTATAYALALVLVYYVSVLTVPGRVISDASLRGAISTAGAVQESVDAILNVISVGSLLAAVAVVASIALLRLDRIRGLAAIGVLVSANAATWLLKEHLLVRPDLGLDEIAPATLNSLPGGHATAAFSAVAALLVVVPAGMRAVTALLGGAFAAATALATMFAGWHRAPDAMAAFLVVGICTMAAAAVVAVYARPRPSSPSAPRMQWPVALAVGTLALGTAMSLALAPLDPIRDTLLGSLAAFLSAGFLILGTLVAVLVSMLKVLEVTDAG